MKKKACIFLAALTVCLSAPCLQGCLLQDPSNDGEKEFLDVKLLGEPTRMPDSDFNWTYYRVITGRMKDASEINVRQETYVDMQKYEKDGVLIKRVEQMKAVLYADNVIETTYTIDGEFAYTERVELIEQDGEKMLLEQRMDEEGKVTFKLESNWSETKEDYYDVYLIEHSIVDSFLYEHYQGWSHYKQEDVYSCYAKNEGEIWDTSLNVTRYWEGEELFQIRINDSVDRFERKYKHEIIRLKQDSEGNETDPYVCGETITEVTVEYGEKTVYYK